MLDWLHTVSTWLQSWATPEMGNLWVLAEALLHAVDPDGNPFTRDGARVINMSLGTLQRTDLLDVVTRLVQCDYNDDDDDESEKTKDRFKDDGYQADRERCIVCGRCFAACPKNVQRSTSNAQLSNQKGDT